MTKKSPFPAGSFPKKTLASATVCEDFFLFYFRPFFPRKTLFMSDAADHDSAPVRIPITGELDLHTFSPREVSAVVTAYLEACLERRIFSVRIIHGKGTGTLRETVHALLRRSPLVAGFRLGDETRGG